MKFIIVTLFLLIGFCSPMFGQERQDSTMPGRMRGAHQFKKDSTLHHQDSLRMNRQRMDTAKIRMMNPTQDPPSRQDPAKKPWINAPVDSLMPKK